MSLQRWTAPYWTLFCSEYLATSLRDVLIRVLGKKSYSTSCKDSEFLVAPWVGVRVILSLNIWSEQIPSCASCHLLSMPVMFPLLRSAYHPAFHHEPQLCSPFPLADSPTLLLVNRVDGSGYNFLLCQKTKHHFQLFHPPLPGTRERKANPSKMREAGKEVASSSFSFTTNCSQERYRRVAKYKKWQLRFAD